MTLLPALPPHWPRPLRWLTWSALLGALAVCTLAAWWKTGRPLAAAWSQLPTQVQVVGDGLPSPWGLAFLPDGRMLVSLKGGRIRVLSPQGQTLGDLDQLPPVVDAGQGGLLDVAVDPDFPRQPWVYWAYAEAGTGTQAGHSGTAVARGRWVEGEPGRTAPRLADIQVIHRQTPKTLGSGHFGARLVFDRSGALFVTLGERQRDQPTQPTREFAQNLRNSLGKVVRITRTGKPAEGNPTWPAAAGQPSALPEIWSLGHRNPQGAALHPSTGALWLTEHGPQGGDELNIARAGGNHGWPLVSHGCPYGSVPGPACQVAGGRHLPPFVAPLTTWEPLSIGPSGLAFYTAERFPAWRGKLFAGALAGRALWMLTLEGERVVQRDTMLAGTWGRIRDVRQGPDGWLYVLTDGPSGQLLRVGPAGR